VRTPLTRLVALLVLVVGVGLPIYLWQSHDQPSNQQDSAFCRAIYSLQDLERSAGVEVKPDEECGFGTLLEDVPDDPYAP